MKKLIIQNVIAIVFIILIGAVIKLKSNNNKYKERIKEINYSSFVLDKDYWETIEGEYLYPYYKVVIYGSADGWIRIPVDSFGGKDLPIYINRKHLELITKKQFHNDRLNR